MCPCGSLCRVTITITFTITITTVFIFCTSNSAVTHTTITQSFPFFAHSIYHSMQHVWALFILLALVQSNQPLTKYMIHPWTCSRKIMAAWSWGDGNRSGMFHSPRRIQAFSLLQQSCHPNFGLQVKATSIMSSKNWNSQSWQCHSWPMKSSGIENW